MTMGRELKRVVVTGAGLVTPLGIGEGRGIFERLIRGENGIRKIPEDSKLVPAGCNVQVAAMIPADDLLKEDKVNEKEVAKFTRYGLISAKYALLNAKIGSPQEFYDPKRCGISFGNGGIGSLSDIVEGYSSLSQSYKKVSPYFVPKILTNLAAGQISIKHGLKGPIHCVTTACAAGAHSIGDAFNFIRLGYADFMLAGSSDASIDPLAISGFARMKALSSSSSTGASRPFDTGRSGFVIGEGAAILVLEELDGAVKRNAPIIAEIIGYGLSGDAYHTTSPSLDGSGASNCMQTALRDAGITMDDVGYINAHATSTPKGDDIEVNAIVNTIKETSKSTRSSQLYVSSTKSSTGHLLGAAGSMESAFTALALQNGIIPPTLHLEEVDPALDKSTYFNHIPKQSIYYGSGKTIDISSNDIFLTEHAQKDSSFQYALKNSFGFGGTNASLVFKRFHL